MKKILLSLVMLTLSTSGFTYVNLSKEGRKNHVANRLEGTWKVDIDMTERLTGKTKAIDKSKGVRLTLKKDKTVVDLINKTASGKKAALNAYAVGTVQSLDNGKDTARGYNYFVLSSENGNLSLRLFNPLKKEGRGDFESAYISLAAAKDTANDILFIGGDRLSEGSGALVRVEEKK